MFGKIVQRVYSLDGQDLGPVDDDCVMALALANWSAKERTPMPDFFFTNWAGGRGQIRKGLGLFGPPGPNSRMRRWDLGD